MKPWARYLLTGVAAAGTLFALAAVAGAETCTLEIKRVGSQTPTGPADYLYRATYPQFFDAQIGTGKTRVRFGGQEEQTAAFKRIVKKEPKYDSDQVFRGVVKFGSQEYAFALDVAAPPEAEAKKEKSEEKDAKSEGEDAKKETKKSETAAGSGLAAALLRALSSEEESPEKTPPKAAGFNRLYFDANHNGDLTRR